MFRICMRTTIPDALGRVCVNVVIQFDVSRFSIEETQAYGILQSALCGGPRRSFDLDEAGGYEGER